MHGQPLRLQPPGSALRPAWGRPELGLEFVHVKEVKGGADLAAHLLECDGVHGRWPHDVRANGDGLVVDGSSLWFTQSPTRSVRRGATSALRASSSAPADLPVKGSKRA